MEVSESQQPLLPIDPDWTLSGWESANQVIDRISPFEIERAMVALREIFPPEWVSGLREHHPIAEKLLTTCGRVALVELGYAASNMWSLCDVVRLRESAEFLSAASELRVALMAHRSGARVYRPDKALNTEEFEYIADYRDGCKLALEVKLPREGAKQSGYRQLETQLLFALMEQSSIPTDYPARATFEFSAESESETGTIAVQERVLAAAQRIRAELRVGVIQKIPLGSIGAIKIRPDSTLSCLQYDAVGIHVDGDDEGRRIRRTMLTKAARQLSKVEHAAILILDLGLNPLLRNAIPFLERWTMRQQQFAATLLLERHFFKSRMYDGVDVLRGPRFGESLPILEAFEFCDSNHLHYCALCSARNPCPCAGVFTELNLGEEESD